MGVTHHGRTERLDLADPTLREWSCTVLASDPETGIVLDRSAFYPGGGVPYAHDLKKAEALLDEAGYKKGPDGIRFALKIVPIQNGEDVPLTTGEFALLKVLVQHPRVPLSRDKLMELARGREFGAFDRSIDVQVSRLRRLIEPEPAKPAFIQTVWGFGYVFVPDGAA